MRTHEVPTHLRVADRILAGLTLRQALPVALGGAKGDWVWEHTLLPPLPGAALAALVVLAGLAGALPRPDGHALPTWLVLLATYALTPHRTVWQRRGAPAAARSCAGRHGRRRLLRQGAPRARSARGGRLEDELRPAAMYLISQHIWGVAAAGAGRAVS